MMPIKKLVRKSLNKIIKSMTFKVLPKTLSVMELFLFFLK